MKNWQTNLLMQGGNPKPWRTDGNAIALWPLTSGTDLMGSFPLSLAGGATWTADGLFSNALNAYATRASHASLTQTTMTLAWWMKRSAVNVYGETLFVKAGGAGTYNYIYRPGSSFGIAGTYSKRIGTLMGNAPYVYNGTDVFAVDTWQHIAVTHVAGSGTWLVYVNGVYHSSWSDGDPVANTSALIIAQQVGASPCTSYTQDMGFWKTAYNATMIGSIHAAGRGGL